LPKPGATIVSIIFIRKHKRFALRQTARLRSKGGRPCASLLIEISLGGCRMSLAGSSSFKVEQLVTVEIAQFAPLAAQVRWVSNGSLGLHFNEPLHVNELDELIRACCPDRASEGRARAYGT
jgi:c-di-GMP-binding flagellar brake protein YcgR